MGILEVILTITAYREGWKAIALIPIAVALLFGIASGLAIKASGGSPPMAAPFGFIADLACVAILAGLTARGPKTASDFCAQDDPSFVPLKAASACLRADTSHRAS